MRTALLGKSLQFALELLNVAEVLLVIFTSAVGIGELLRRAWDAVLPALADTALMVIRDRGEEIGSRPSLRTIKAKIKEVLLRVFRATKVETLALSTRSYRVSPAW
jgi:hypothetical protein